MFNILTLNNISQTGLQEFDPQRFNISDHHLNPHALLLRSFDLHNFDIPSSVELIVRAGAGTNNIPLAKATTLGIPVLNTPGANANAVKELVITGMLLACRNICAAWDYVKHLDPHTDIHALVEQQKKYYVGSELPGKTLGVIGLGHVGVKVANAALALDMNVIGYDPAMTVHNAWELSAAVKQALTIDDVLKNSDFITLHVPLLDATKHLINSETIKKMRQGVILLNFARDGIIDNQALLNAITTQHIARYVCDFPEVEFLENSNIICLPHLGASTYEAEENCAVMAVQQIMQYFESAQIKHSVNFPNVTFPKKEGQRIAIVNANVPNMVAQISRVLSEAHYNIIDMINQSRYDIAYTLIDIDGDIQPEVITQLKAIEGVMRVRKIA